MRTPSFLCSSTRTFFEKRKGKERRINTGNGATIAYAHTLRIEIKGFATRNVLIDFMPNLHTPLLGVKSLLGYFVLTVNYPKKAFSLRLPTRA